MYQYQFNIILHKYKTHLQHMAINNCLLKTSFCTYRALLGQLTYVGPAPPNPCYDLF